MNDPLRNRHALHTARGCANILQERIRGTDLEELQVLAGTQERKHFSADLLRDAEKTVLEDGFGEVVVSVAARDEDGAQAGTQGVRVDVVADLAR
jgi:hypothetical protein